MIHIFLYALSFILFCIGYVIPTKYPTWWKSMYVMAVVSAYTAVPVYFIQN